MHYHYLFAPSCYYCSLQYNTHKPFVCGKMLFPSHFHSTQKQTHSCLSWHAAPPDAIMILIKESFIDCLNHFMTSSIRTIFAICSQLTVSTLSLMYMLAYKWIDHQVEGGLRCNSKEIAYTHFIHTKHGWNIVWWV